MSDIDTIRKRLLFRSWHRGCKETDVILGPFAEARLMAFSADDIAIYESFLEEFDSDIWDWLVGKNDRYDKKYQRLIEQLRQFAESRHAA